MRKIFALILLTAAGLVVCGCSEPEKTYPGVPLEGIKIGDLAPRHKEKLPPVITFRIFTFHIPQKNYIGMSKAFNILLKKPLHFSNYKAFRANGFDVGFGRNDLWGFVGNKLQDVNAKKVNVNNMIFYDENGNDVYGRKISSNTTVRYIANDGSSAQAELANGAFAWRIKAKKLAKRRGAAQVKIQGMFVKGYGNFMSRFPGMKTKGEVIFKPAGMIMNMDEGDFILLGPHPEIDHSISRGNIDNTDLSLDQGNLASWFFNLRGNFTMPKPPRDEANNSSGQTYYEIKKNVPLVKVYLIACMGVEN